MDSGDESFAYDHQVIFLASSALLSLLFLTVNKSYPFFLICVAKCSLFCWLSFLRQSLNISVPKGLVFWPLAFAVSYSLGGPGQVRPSSTGGIHGSIQTGSNASTSLPTGRLSRDVPKGSQRSSTSLQNSLSIPMNHNGWQSFHTPFLLPHPPSFLIIEAVQHGSGWLGTHYGAQSDSNDPPCDYTLVALRPGLSLAFQHIRSLSVLSQLSIPG